MRRSIAIYVIFALAWAFLRDPFYHLHGGQEHGHDEPGHDNLGLIAHTHLELLSASASHHGETTVGVPQDRHNAQPLSFFQLKEETPPFLTLQVQPVALVSPPVPSEFTTCEPTPRTHDPPLAYASAPRSPPA
jgi:hypothetical protein